MRGKPKLLRLLRIATGLAIGCLPLANLATAERNPDAKPYELPLRMGQWDRGHMGAFMPRPEDQLVTRKYFGMRHTETWFDLFVRDKAGTYYLVSNVALTPAAGAAMVAAPWLPVASRSSDGTLVPDQRTASWHGKATQELTKEGKVRYLAEAKDSSDEVVFDDKAMSWSSKNGDIRIQGTLTSPGMQMLLPWREPDGSTDAMYYTVQFYEVRGTYHGEPVEGYSAIEHAWGNKNYRDNWWVKNRLVHWGWWTTTYDDGTTEMGDVLCGEHGARAILITNNKGETVLNTTELNAERTADGRVVYSFGRGPSWEFIPEIKQGEALAIGLTRRVGEARKIVRSQALNLNYGKMCSPMRLGQSETR